MRDDSLDKGYVQGQRAVRKGVAWLAGVGVALIGPAARRLGDAAAQMREHAVLAAQQRNVARASRLMQVASELRGEEAQLTRTRLRAWPVPALSALLTAVAAPYVASGGDWEGASNLGTLAFLGVGAIIFAVRGSRQNTWRDQIKRLSW